MKQIAGQLAAKGWVALAPDPRDGRVTRIHLTPKVADAWADPAVARSGAELVGRATRALDDDAAAQTLATMQAWIHDLAEPKETP